MSLLKELVSVHLKLMVSLFVHRGLWSLDKEKLDIPVMYDDQHGGSNISSVVFLNALELTEEGYNRYG